jgi:hypothetical protein
MANFNIFTFNINDLNRVNVQQLFQQDIEADVQVHFREKKVEIIHFIQWKHRALGTMEFR